MNKKLQTKIQEILGLENLIFSIPPKAEMGDIALPCFDLAKKEKQNPTTSEEFIKEIMSEPLPKVSKKDIALDTDTELNDSSTKIEAERKTAILKSKMLVV